jgi:hypothetical protein
MAGRIDNLRPWKPGQSGNPCGRPKRKWLTDAIEEMLQERLDDPKAPSNSKMPCGAALYLVTVQER